TIPASALKTPVGYYNKIRCNAWTDNDENKYKPFFSMISGSAQLKSDTSDLLMSKASPITMSFDPSTAAVVGENLKRIRIDLNDRPFIEPVTIYLSDIYFFEDSNNFTWEIVE
ncbi:MAG: hypothetical protein RR413_12095, partial [Christensenellaceae bacterium]